MRGIIVLQGLLGGLLLSSSVAAAQDAECVPACRSGYLCHEGQCISACNPPCSAGEQCTSAGECVAQPSVPPPAQTPPAQVQPPGTQAPPPGMQTPQYGASPPPPATQPPPGAPPQGFASGATPPPPQGQASGGWVSASPGGAPPGTGYGPPPMQQPRSAGWASTAGALGLVSASLVLGLAIGAEVTKEDQVPSLFPLGVGATLALGVMAPVTASGAASARQGGVSGAPGMRIAGWIGYALALVDAVSLVILGASEIEPPDGVITSVGILGAASIVFFSIDAFASASEASSGVARPSPSWAPGFAVRPNREGGVDVLGGLTTAF